MSSKHVEQLTLIVIEQPHHRSHSTANRMTATESLFFGRLNEFYNKICQKLP